MTPYEKITGVGRIVQRRARMAAAEGATIALVSAAGFVWGCIAAGNGQGANALLGFALAAGTVPPALGALVRHARLVRSFEKMAVAYLDAVERDIAANVRRLRWQARAMRETKDSGRLVADLVALAGRAA
jgi:hypothetical protein